MTVLTCRYVLDHNCDQSAFDHSEYIQEANVVLFVGETDLQAAASHGDSQT